MVVLQNFSAIVTFKAVALRIIFLILRSCVSLRGVVLMVVTVSTVPSLPPPAPGLTVAWRQPVDCYTVIVIVMCSVTLLTACLMVLTVPPLLGVQGGRCVCVELVTMCVTQTVTRPNVLMMLKTVTLRIW